MPIRRAKATRVVAFALCLVGAGPLSADVVPSTAGTSAVPSSTEPQAAAPAEAAAGKPSGPEMTSVQRDALVVELSTAGYYELAARARELGLPVTGEAEEIAREPVQILWPRGAGRPEEGQGRHHREGGSGELREGRGGGRGRRQGVGRGDPHSRRGERRHPSGRGRQCRLRPGPLQPDGEGQSALRAQIRDERPTSS